MHGLQQPCPVLVVERDAATPYLRESRTGIDDIVCAEIKHPEDLIDILGELPRSLFALEICNVDIGADIAGKLAAGSIARNAAAQNPPVFSVPTAQAALQVEGPTGVKRGAEGFGAASGVLWMNTGCPAVTEFLFQAPAGECQPGLIDKAK